jgi:hypothetical protein
MRLYETLGFVMDQSVLEHLEFGSYTKAAIMLELMLGSRSDKTVSRLARRRFFLKTNERTNNFFFAFLLFTAKKTKFVRSFFGRIYDMPICFRFYLTFKKK